MSKEDPEYPLAISSFQMKNYMYGKGHNKAVKKKALREESGNGSGIRYGSLRIISPVPPSSGTLRGPEEEAAQSNPGGEVCKTSWLRRISFG